MKKFLSILTVATAIAMFSFSCTSNKTIAEKTTNKTIDLAVFTDNNYSNKIYDAATAGLTVTVKKLTKNNVETLVEKSFPALALKFFPAAINAFKAAIEIPSVKEKDVLQVSYTLTYSSNGSLLLMQGDEMFTGKDGSKLEINI